jgi:hypothetical protein
MEEKGWLTWQAIFQLSPHQGEEIFLFSLPLSQKPAGAYPTPVK